MAGTANKKSFPRSGIGTGHLNRVGFPETATDGTRRTRSRPKKNNGVRSSASSLRSLACSAALNCRSRSFANSYLRARGQRTASSPGPQNRTKN